jgi:hypothetical protein
MAVRRMEALPLAELLGTLLGSVVEAHAQAARATVDFVEDVGFESTAEGERLRTVAIRYSKTDENGQVADFVVQVPMLALVNVPVLAVRQAKLAFSYDVVTQKEATATSNEAGLGSRRPAALTGFVRSKPGTASVPSTRSTASIDLDVTLEQQELPVGVERLFDLAELGITESAVPASEGG